MPTQTDRTKIKKIQEGTYLVAPLTAAKEAVSQLHEETFTFEISSDVALAEIGVAIRKACVVKNAYFTPSSALAIDGTSHVAYTVSKRDGAGGAAVSTATLSTFTGGTALAAFVPAALAITATAANKTFAAGNVLTAKSAETGTPTSPVGVLSVTVEYI